MVVERGIKTVDGDGEETGIMRAWEHDGGRGMQAEDCIRG